MHPSLLRSSRLWTGSLTALLALAGLLPLTGEAQTGLQQEPGRSLVLPLGRSTLLHFDRMKRVEVIEPTIVEVVVASVNDLSVYGRKPGMTTLYVWDRRGLHQFEATVLGVAPAEVLMQNLRRVLGNRLIYTASSDRVLVVEGTLPAEEAERARKVIQAAGTQEVQIVDLIKTEGATDSPAIVAAQALRKVLGDQFEYVVWNNSTLLVRGGIADKNQLERAHKVLEAAKTPGLSIIDLLDYSEPQVQPPVEEIARAVGEQFQVWRVSGQTVAVGGTVMTKAELENLDKLLEAFKEQARIVNLVQVVPPRQNLKDAIALVQSAVGDKVTVRAVGGEALFVEGAVPSDAELKRVQSALTNVKVDYQVVDLLRVAAPPKRQVLVHARIVLIDRSALSRIGITHGQLRTTTDGILFSDQPWLMQLEAGINNIYTLGAQLDALRTKDLAQTLSEPNVLVDDGGKASVLAGGEIPIPVTQPGGGASAITVEWRPYGVQLEIEPTILPDSQRINVKASPKVSSLDYGNQVSISGFALPALRTTQAETEVTIESGRTLVIGGLLHKEDAKTISKIPLLSQIPIIGELFKHREFQNGTSELVIMITPEILGEKTEAKQP